VTANCRPRLSAAVAFTLANAERFRSPVRPPTLDAPAASPGLRIPVILIMVFSLPEEGTADSITLPPPGPLLVVGARWSYSGDNQPPSRCEEGRPDAG
jgi:hypothetical protein